MDSFDEANQNLLYLMRLLIYLGLGTAHVDLMNTYHIVSCRMEEWKLITSATQEAQLRSSLVGSIN